MRSKMLLASNIVASLYCIILLWTIIGVFIIDAEGKNIINAIGSFFEWIFDNLNLNLEITRYLFIQGILFLIHSAIFVFGTIISWISYLLKKDITSIVAAIVYLVGTIVSPICIIFGIPITTLAFVGAVNQKKVNQTK